MDKICFLQLPLPPPCLPKRTPKLIRYQRSLLLVNMGVNTSKNISNAFETLQSMSCIQVHALWKVPKAAEAVQNDTYPLKWDIILKPLNSCYMCKGTGPPKSYSTTLISPLPYPYGEGGREEDKDRQFGRLTVPRFPGVSLSSPNPLYPSWWKGEWKGTGDWGVRLRILVARWLPCIPIISLRDFLCFLKCSSQVGRHKSTVCMPPSWNYIFKNVSKPISL